MLAKKGRRAPTTLTYDEALDEALCQGWIDGQVSRRDDNSFRQRFTPRRRRSRWSARNVDLVERLRSAGRMCEAGEAEVGVAMADGRWCQRSGNSLVVGGAVQVFPWSVVQVIP